MAVTIRIPTPLRQMTNGAESVEVEGGDVNELLLALCAKFEGMDKRLFKQPGELNRFVNIYVNEEDIRFLDNLQTKIKPGDDVSVVPAIAGG
ncbi:MAG: molybdopterin synthase sulfur carrier subunit [Phycisphaerae bacterium]|nr:molybdopterin synthase sulfur carrier subunit [Phycisphaerae bacterium]